MVASAGARARARARAREIRVLRRAVRRLRPLGAQPLHRPEIARPIGLKAELTHRCNLRCGHCYTDSPRRTLEGVTDLSDDEWRAIVGEALELGIIEAVITGGEPLLRRELAL